MTDNGPQLENGYTRIANEFLEALIRYRVPGEQMQIFLFILRKTWGFKKKSDAIALKQFVADTGLKKPTICRALKTLEEKRLIVIKNDNAIAKTYRINKHFENWKPLSKKITLSKKIMPVIKKDNRPLSFLSTTKESITKETITKESNTFAHFWAAYPKKRSKGQAEKAWKKLKMNEKLFNQIMTALERAKQSREWMKDGGQFVPYPSTWLNAKGWEDEYEIQKTTGNKLHDKILEVGAAWLEKNETDS